MKQIFSIAGLVLLTGCLDDGAQPYLQTLDIAEQGIDGISIDTNSITIREPDVTAQWAVAATLSSGSELDYSEEVDWSSDAPEVATVSSSGEIVTIGAGVANISARYGRFSDVQTFTVSTANLQSISLTPAIISFDECRTIAVSAEGSYDDGTTRDINDLLSWSTDDTSVASVLDQSGSGITLASHNAGTGTLTATNNDGINGTASLVILDTLTSIMIDQTSLSLTVGDTASLSAQAEYSDSSSEDITQTADWSLDASDQSNIVSLSNTAPNRGELSAMTAGDATISVECGGIAATQSSAITVSAEATLDSLSFSPSDNPYVISTTDTDESITVFANFSDGSGSRDVTEDVIWEVVSGDTNLIDIDTSDDNEGDILLDDDISDITEDVSIAVEVTFGALNAQIQIIVEAP